MIRNPAVVCATALVALLCSCSSDTDHPKSAGPLWTSNAQSRYCIPLNGKNIITIAYDIVALNGKNKATIDKVSLVRPVNMRMLDSKLLKFRHGDNLLGASMGYPPSLARTSGLAKEWSNYLPAAGFDITPSPYQYNLLTGLQLKGEGSASIDGFRISYHSDGKAYELDTASVIELRKTARCF